MPHRKIRVLIIDQAIAFGGSIVVAARLVRALDPNLVDSRVVSEMDPEILRVQFGDWDRVDVVRHTVTYTHHARVMRWVSEMPLSGLLMRPVMYATSLVSAVANVVYVWRIALRIVIGRIDIVHMNNGMDNSEAALVTWLLRRRILVHCHGPAPMGLLRRFLVRRAHGYVAVSNHIKDYLVAHGVAAQNVEVIPNPAEKMTIDEGLVRSVRARYHLRPEQRVFGIFGRIVGWKGHREFVLAASEVVKRMPEAVAFIVGDVSDGDRRLWDDLQELVRQQGLADRFVFTGYIARIVELYGIMDVVVHASTWPEPFGLVIIEAMGCGIPVIASNLGAPSEIIDDGKDGLIVDPKNTPALAQALLDLLGNESLRRDMGQRARQKVLSRYGAEEYASRMEGVYRRAMGMC